MDNPQYISYDSLMEGAVNMTVMRIHKTANYTVMANYHFKEKEMTLKAKGLLSLMLSLPDDWNYSVSGLVKLSKDGKDGVMSALAELEKFRYLERQRTTDEKGRFSGIEYHIYEQPQQEKPIAANPISEKEHTEKQDTEKPPQLNTNPLNTNLLNIELLNTKVKDETLRGLYADYIEMRNSIKAPLTDKGLQALIARVDRLSKFDMPTKKRMLETAIINGWKNVYGEGEEPEINPHRDERMKFYLE